MELWQVEYFLLAGLVWFLAYIFYCTKNGILRRLFISFYFMMGLSLIGRALTGFIPGELWQQQNRIFNQLVIVGLLVVTIVKVYILSKEYLMKKKE